jgi:hypothetical protein
MNRLAFCGRPEIYVDLQPEAKAVAYLRLEELGGRE